MGIPDLDNMWEDAERPGSLPHSAGQDVLLWGCSHPLLCSRIVGRKQLRWDEQVRCPEIGAGFLGGVLKGGKRRVQPIQHFADSGGIHAPKRDVSKLMSQSEQFFLTRQIRAHVDENRAAAADGEALQTGEVVRLVKANALDPACLDESLQRPLDMRRIVQLGAGERT